MQYAPQLVLISAGFDPHRRDPLGGMEVTEQGFAAMARSLLGVAEQVAGGRCVAVLEGGYDLHAMRDSAGVVLDELCAASRAPLPAPPRARRSRSSMRCGANTQLLEILSAELSPQRHTGHPLCVFVSLW